LDYYFEIKKPNEFRTALISGVKECIIIQRNQEKLELIRQAKKDLFKEITTQTKELNELIKKLETLLVDDELKKEIQQEIINERENEKKEREQTKQEQIFKIKKEREQQTTNPPKKFFETEPQKKEPETSNKEIKNFEYTLEQIEKKLAELKRN
jgi:signal recognition particle GTPase